MRLHPQPLGSSHLQWPHGGLAGHGRADGRGAHLLGTNPGSHVCCLFYELGCCAVGGGHAPAPSGLKFAHLENNSVGPVTSRGSVYIGIEHFNGKGGVRTRRKDLGATQTVLKIKSLSMCFSQKQQILISFGKLF